MFDLELDEIENKLVKRSKKNLQYVDPVAYRNMKILSTGKTKKTSNWSENDSEGSLH